jgi:chromosomal replication initiator protein
MNDSLRDPAIIWETAYGELQLQLPREVFDTWLRPARLLAHEDGSFIVGVQNTYARDWLEHRLKKVIVRTLSSIAGRTVEVQFVLWTEHNHQEQNLSDAGPLLADLTPHEEPPAYFEQTTSPESSLNPRYTFDEYVIGEGNRLAHAAAMAVVNQPGGQFNPLYIQGGVGMGKTHLLNAIGHACVEKGHRVLYASSEQFTNDLVGAIRSRETQSFRQKYRSVDVLLLDDIEFVAGKSSTQEEFYHTFNALFSANAQIVAASSRSPGQIAKLEDRLRSRFDGGLVVELGPLDAEARLEALLLKVERRGDRENIPFEVLEMVARQSEGSMRDLEGALNRLIAATLLGDQMPTVHLAERIAQESPQSTAISLDEIIPAVANYYDILPEQIVGRDRAREVSIARQVVMYLAREKADLPLKQIGEALGGRNHSTVLYGCEQIANLMAADTQVRRQVQAVMYNLRVPLAS